MTISALFIRRPVMTTLVMMGILGFGLRRRPAACGGAGRLMRGTRPNEPRAARSDARRPG